MSGYYKKLLDVKAFVEESANQIFQVYGNELELKLEDYNLLAHKNNCLESSTAIGFIIEEFLVSKLEKYTACRQNAIGNVVRNSGSTVKSSYDCSLSYSDVLTLINIKAQKSGQSNDGVAAINKLHDDFVKNNPEQKKSYLVLKVIYSYSAPDNNTGKKIIIKKVKSYYLDEVDLSHGHKQDHRNWSTEFKPLSGRLKISDSFLKSNRVDEENISYENTVKMLNAIVSGKSR